MKSHINPSVKQEGRCWRIALATTFQIGLLAMLIMTSPGLTAQVGVHTDFPDNSAAMDIVSSTRGLLVPRVTLTNDLTSPSPVTAPAVGLMVFNSGANQPLGFYYWDGVQWVAIGAGGGATGDYWSLTGNTGTDASTNFVGTTDAEDLVIRTNDAERVRVMDNGQVLIGMAAPYFPTDLLSISGNSSQNYALNVYSPYSGVYTSSGFVGFYNIGGYYGIYSRVDTAVGYGLFCRNLDPSGYSLLTAGSGASASTLGGRSAGVSSSGSEGMISMAKTTTGWGLITAGSNRTPSTLTGRSGGISCIGDDGIFAGGKSATGRGIIAGGNNPTDYYISSECEGGAFTGWHGVFARTTNADGIGVIGIGSSGSTYTSFTGGVGGSFVGGQGVYGKGTAATGMGVIGVGNNGSTYYTLAGGSGASFTGNHGLLAVGTNTTDGTGVVGAGNGGGYTVYASGSGGSFSGVSVGALGYGSNATNGTGVVGAGNGFAPVTLSTGSGGAFTGYEGVFARASNASGSGVIAVGNSLATPGSFAGGCGGEFTGATAGVVAWAQNSATGTGVIAAGNNAAISTLGTGSGGAFTGTVCGVYGYATNSANDRYGGYFATNGGNYAYVGGRYSSTNRKIVGSGTVSTIVKNRQGERITLTCPEAPDIVFQDFGTGQLQNGYAHIAIDPDLAINIRVSEEYPLKVYITPEGDCNGVYVTNKSASGFDVFELMGGTSNVPFSWQIVATRANEEYELEDGTIEISDYSTRFAPAPPPLGIGQDPGQPQGTNHPDNDAREVRSEKIVQLNTVRTNEIQSQVIQHKEEQIINPKDETR